jgi:hypothetical protein
MPQFNDIDWTSEQWRTIEFYDTMQVFSVERGRSAANFIFKSLNDDCKYTVFLSDMLDMLCGGHIAYNSDIGMNIIEGTFIVVKKGQNFGIKLKNTKKYEQPLTKYSRTYRPIPRYVGEQLCH